MNLKNLQKNTAFYSFTIFLQRGSSFLLIPVYTHFLSLKEYGLLAAILLSIRVIALPEQAQIYQHLISPALRVK